MYLQKHITLGEKMQKKMGEIEKDGPDVELNTMAYDRVSTRLQTVCRNLVKRIEALESKLNSNELCKYGNYYTNNGKISL